MTAGTSRVLLAIAAERDFQDEKWGEQNPPDGTDPSYSHLAEAYRSSCEIAFKCGVGTWRHILTEEVFEAFAETDRLKLRDELVQVAAVAAAWIECIDRAMAIA